MMLTKNWFNEAIEADRAGKVSRTIDIIYDNFDRLLSCGRFEEVDALIEAVPADDVSIHFLLAVLSITFPVSPRQSRRVFFEKVYTIAAQRKHDPERLLGGMREWTPLPWNV